MNKAFDLIKNLEVILQFLPLEPLVGIQVINTTNTEHNYMVDKELTIDIRGVRFGFLFFILTIASIDITD